MKSYCVIFQEQYGEYFQICHQTATNVKEATEIASNHLGDVRDELIFIRADAICKTKVAVCNSFKVAIST